MKNLFKKIIASFMCFSLLTLQATFAEGIFAGKDILDPIDGQGGATIKDHTDGLTGITTTPDGNNASLTFGKDTVIDWNILNVLKGQKLDFNNGSYAVLNNVLNGMSTFAGQITGDSGAIIIANPNGMIMTGGSIETSGALILTTQDLYNNYGRYFQDNKLDIDNLLKDSKFQNDAYKLITLNDGSIISGTINIIAKGIDINSANLTASAVGGNVVLRTTDGATFTAESAVPSIPKENFENIKIANSSVTTKDGNINLVVNKGHANITGSTFTGDTNISTGGQATINAENKPGIETNINGNLNIVAGGSSCVRNTNVKDNDTSINSQGLVYVEKLNTKNLSIDSKTSTSIRNSNVVENLEVFAGKELIDNPDNDYYYAAFYMENSDVGSLDVTTHKGAIHLNGGSVNGDANLIADTEKSGTGNIIIGYNSSDPYDTNETTRNSTNISGNITVDSSRWVNAYSNNSLTFVNPNVAEEFTAISDGNVNIYGGSIWGNAILNAVNQIIIGEFNNQNANLYGSLTANAGTNLGLWGTKIAGLTDLTTEKGLIYLFDIYAGDSLIADSNQSIDMRDSTVIGQVDATAGKELIENTDNDYYYAAFYMENSDVGSLDVTTHKGAIHLNGGSVNGDANLIADTEKSDSGNIIIGYNSSDPYDTNETTKNSTNISGNITVDSSRWVNAYSDNSLTFVNPNVAEEFTAISDGNVNIYGGSIFGNAILNAVNQVIIGKFNDNNTYLYGSLTANAGTNLGLWGTKITGLTDLTTEKGLIYLFDIYAGDSLIADSNQSINMTDSTVIGQVDATAGKELIKNTDNGYYYAAFYMENSNAGSLDVTTHKGAIHLNGGSVNGDANLIADTEKSGTGNIIIGYNSSDPYDTNETTRNSTNISGNITVDSSRWVNAYSENNLNFTNANIKEDFTAVSSNGHVSVKNADVDGNANFTAKNGVKIWFSDFAKDLTAKFTGEKSVGVPEGANTTDPPHDLYIAYSNVHGNAKLTASNASDAQITVSNTTIDNNLDAKSAGSVALWQANVGKHVNAKAENGNVSLNGGDKQTEVGSLTADAKQNIIINNSKVKGNANLKAGLDIRSTNSSYVGNIIANAKNGSFKDSKGDLKFYNTNIENKLSANTDGNISLDSNANNVNEALMNQIGSIDFETEDGNIKIWDTNVSNDTKLTSNKGNILLADSYTNTANITNNEGNISVSNVKANTVNTTNNISGETVISSKGNKINDLNSIAKGNAKITLNNASVGNANLNSQNGNISINSTKADNITATSTENGKISMMYSNITGKFKANAKNGDIVLDADESKMNQTVGSLDLKTENGNINIWDTKVTNTAKLNAKNGNILSSNANYGGNITADAKNAIFDSSKAGKLNFVDSNITGNLKATADNKVALNNSTVGGKFTGKSNNYETTVNHSTVGSAELTSKWNNSFNNSTSNGDIKMSSEGGHSTINASTIKGSAELTAKGNAAINGSTVDGDATVKATDGKASIWESIVGKKATVTSENYEAAIGAGDGKTSQVGSAEIKSKWNNRLYNTTVNESAKLTSTNGHSSVSNATIKGNAELTAKGNAAINSSTVDGDATVNATDGKASIWESIVGKKATVTSENYEAAIGASEGKTSQVGSAEIKSKWNNRLYNTTVNGDAKLTSTNGNSSVSNATIKGNAELTAKVSAAVSDSNIESNATVQSETGKASIYKSSVTGIAKVTSSKNEAAIGESQVGTADMYGETGARFYNSKSNGELKIKANTGDVNITNATVRNVNATSHKANINVKNTETTGNSRNHFTAKNGNVTSTNSNYIGSIKAEVGKTADFNTDKNITFDYVSADKLNVVSNNENIGIIGNIIADKINLTATNGSIYATTNALLDGNTYNLKALNQIASLDDISDVMNKTDYDWSLQNAINIAGGTVETLSAGIASVHSNGNVTFVTPETTKGNLRLSSDGDLMITNGANVGQNLLTQADGSITSQGDIIANLDVKAYATDDINIENVNAGRNLELKSNKGNINLGNDSKASSVSGKTTLTADKDINVKNYTSTDSFNATSNNGAITLNKASVGNRAIPAGQYKGITLNAKKDITVNNSYSHGKFIANSTEGSVTVGNTGVETQGSDITAGKDVNLNQFHSAAHVNITAGENVNAKAIGTSANQSIWTVKAGKDANFENLNLNNKNGGLNVEANNININNAPSVGIKPNVQGQVDLKANNDIKIENGTEFGSKLNATAENNISLDRKGDLTINNSSPMSLKAGNTVSVSTDGQLVIDNLTSNDIVNGTNVNFAGANITTNNSTYHTNVGMNSKGDVTFTGSNTINGDLTISASKDSGFVAINGDSTNANNITVNGAQYIEANNVETGYLQFNDFEIGHILNTTADSTGFTNGNDLYININTIIRNQKLEPSIINSATNVDRIIFYPRSTDGGDGSDLSGLDEDAALILGYLRDKAIDTRLGSDFAPIGFAAHEGRRGGLHRMDIGDSVYRALQENIDTLHITDRFNIDQ